jgi:very-short-patch-repair endonuclease
MKDLHTTPEAEKLYEVLLKNGIKAEKECGDGHKHVDICVPTAKLYIEVEGPPHFLSARQILADFKRDDYSTADGFETLRIPNHYIHEHLFKLVGAIKKVVEKRMK